MGSYGIIIINGQEFPCHFCWPSSLDILHIIIDASIVDAASAFSQVDSLLHRMNDKETDYSAYSVITTIAREREGLRVSLRRPYYNEIGGTGNG